jgi:O-antigen/teichoic acid export membrane protein
VHAFAGVYARRALGVVSIGKVAWTGAVLSYFALLLNPGLQTIAKREVARSPEEVERYVSLLLLIQVLLALITYGLVLGFAGLHLREPQINTLLALQGLGLLMAPFDLDWLLQARERMTVPAILSVCLSALHAVALVLIISDPSHVTRYVLLPYPFQLARIAFTGWYAHNLGYLRWRALRFGFHGSAALLKAALLLSLSGAAVLVYYNSDTVILGLFRGDDEVGLYSTAYNLMLVPTYIGGALLKAYFPSLARAFGDEGQAEKLSAEFLRLMMWIGFPMAFLGWAAGRHVLILLFGSRFTGSGSLFEWLSLNLALVYFNMGYNQPLAAWQHQKLVFRCTLTGAFVNVVANLAIIPKWGAPGAVATTILAEVTVMIMTIVARQSVYPIRWFQPALRTLLVSVGAAVIAQVIDTVAGPAPALISGLAFVVGGIYFLEPAWVCKFLYWVRQAILRRPA